ncbi:cell wall-binding repeat-containing protein [Catenulispora sp. NL8]|uniref:Cell wall-binding repeat-containing protein n=1 Tax=Catenulispora pinistramenti TaxID=2705254 RepID=A0ABS5KR44_9ACTN|nr:cell wall-binding repeat-containing protein [Catenulispora pinistramenti]MBS2548512.1 cell wall-binding repeat-containing protein [Catenulispora pinistramenti]
MVHARRVVAAAICGGVGLAMAQPVVARAGEANDVFVNSDKAVCSDATGAGSQAAPFCTVSAALASPSVVAGTSLWLTGSFAGGIDITKSGVALQASSAGAFIAGGAYGISVAGQHDVTVRGLRFLNTSGEALKVSSSSSIAVSGIDVQGAQKQAPAAGTAGAAVRFDDVAGATITDSTIHASLGTGVLIDAGSTGVVVSNDIIDSISGNSAAGGGVSVADSSDVDVVADTVDGVCGTAIAVAGTADDVRIENDIADANQGICGYDEAGVAVAASAVSGTVVSHTIANTGKNGWWNNGGPAFRWGTTDYTDAAAFDAAGHGTADLVGDPKFAGQFEYGGDRGDYSLTTDSPAIDSADGSARNEPATDMAGGVRKPDPIAAEAGLGTGTPAYADRGALEFQPTPPPTHLSLGVDQHAATYRHVIAEMPYDTRWPVTGCVFVFDDGYKSSGPTCKADHTYPTDGPHTVAMTATDAYGNTWTDTSSISLAPDTVKPEFAASQFNGLVTVTIVTKGLATATVDYGDGRPPVTVNCDGAEPCAAPAYQYSSSGSYTITVNGTDTLGFTGSATHTLDVLTYGHPTVHRVAGPDRYATAVAASEAQWAAGSAGAVVLASGADFPDALTGVPLAAHVHGPLLLSDRASIASVTVAEITRVLGTGSGKTVYLLGGTNALSDAVASALPADYKIVRLAGSDRFDTARRVAQTIGPSAHVVVASGRTFADALTAGPLAARQGAPILLADGPTLDPATAAAVAAHASITAVGGPAVAAVRTALPGRAFTALYGQDRYQTATAVINAMTAGAIPHSVSVASGVNFPDALAGGAFAANAGQPLALTDPHHVSSDLPLEQWHLYEWDGTVSVFGGSAAIGDEVVAEIVRDTGGHPM